MRFLHRHEKSEGDGKLSPIWSRSPRSAKSPKSPGSPKSPKSPERWTYARKNKDGLNQCLACNVVEDLIRLNVEQQRLESDTRRPWAPLHNSFAELDECAATCHFCRVFRQALLLEEVTFKGLDCIHDSQGEVYVRWKGKITGAGVVRNFLEVIIRGQPDHTGTVYCSERNDIPHLALDPDGRSNTLIEQAKGWLDDCIHNHVGDCDNLGFSNEPPRLLAEIISPNLIQLRKKQPGEYVALSYCWGKETDATKRAKTVTNNLKSRCDNAFNTDILPSTVSDAVRLVSAMGYRYIWVDYLCIDQKTFEGGKEMHMVYSNALFTLCACATTAATDRLLDQRKAWRYKTEPCRLGGQWLTTPDMSLNELRLRSPLAARAWTLQEERLSPRMLYITSSKVYWSCAIHSKTEVEPALEQKATTVLRPVYSATDRDSGIASPQEFLMACRLGRRDMHGLWADIVASYALRDMREKKDRLTALSGLAARYLAANDPDRYLAGIWAGNLSDGLAWRVDRAVSHKKSDSEGPKWPSWSWAALPVQTAIKTNANSPQSNLFQLIPDEHPWALNHGAAVELTIERGEQVKRLCVTGRIRALWKSPSHLVNWSIVSSRINGMERFTFSANPQQDMHAIDPRTGRILVYEGRKREVISQLDFVSDVERLRTSQVEILGLEIGETTMLLLEQRQDGAYRRLGVAWDVRKDFFASVTEQHVLILV